MTKVLVVDDSALMRRRIGQILSARGCEVESARNGADALKAVEAFAPDVITLDINMPEMDGLTFLGHLMSSRPTPVVMVSSLTEAGALATFEALELGAVDFVHKPDGTVSLNIERVEEVLAEKVLAASRARLRRSHGLKDRLRADRSRISTGAKPVEPQAREKSGALVLIGASTGGPRTLEEVLSGLPASFPLPVLVCQHMPATFTGPFSRRLNDVCPLVIQEVTRPTPVLPGTIYIGRGDADLVLVRRGSELVATSVPCDGRPWHPSIGRLVESAMQVVPAELLLGAMLTGMGNDGAIEMAEMRRAGGHAIAEAEETCVVFGMPQALIAQGGADLVLPAPRVARQLNAWAGQLAGASRAVNT